MKKCEDCTDYSCPHRGMECFYEYEAELQASEEFKEKAYWQSFRAEATKDILCALITNPNELPKGDLFLISHAIFLSNELVKQLKEKEEK